MGDLTDKSQKTTEHLMKSSNSLLKTTGQISMSAEEISKTIDDVAKGMSEQEICATIQEQSAITTSAHQEVQDLQSLADELKESVSVFTIS